MKKFLIILLIMLSLVGVCFAEFVVSSDSDDTSTVGSVDSASNDLIIDNNKVIDCSLVGYLPLDLLNKKTYIDDKSDRKYTDYCFDPSDGTMVDYGSWVVKYSCKNNKVVYTELQCNDVSAFDGICNSHNVSIIGGTSDGGLTTLDSSKINTLKDKSESVNNNQNSNDYFKMNDEDREYYAKEIFKSCDKKIKIVSNWKNFCSPRNNKPGALSLNLKKYQEYELNVSVPVYEDGDKCVEVDWEFYDINHDGIKDKKPLNSDGTESTYETRNPENYKCLKYEQVQVGTECKVKIFKNIKKNKFCGFPKHKNDSTCSDEGIPHCIPKGKIAQCDCLDKGEGFKEEIQNIDCNILANPSKDYIEKYGKMDRFLKYSGNYSKFRICDGCYWSNWKYNRDICKPDSCVNNTKKLYRTAFGYTCSNLDYKWLGTQKTYGNGNIVEFCGYFNGKPTHGKAACVGNWWVDPINWDSHCDTGWKYKDSDYYEVYSCISPSFKKILKDKEIGVNNKVSFCGVNKNGELIQQVATCRGFWMVDKKKWDSTCTTGWEDSVSTKVDSCEGNLENCECLNKDKVEKLENLKCGIVDGINYTGTYTKERFCNGCQYSSWKVDKSKCIPDSCVDDNSKLIKSSRGVKCVKLRLLNIGDKKTSGFGNIVKFCGYNGTNFIQAKATCKGKWFVDPNNWISKCDSGWIVDIDDFKKVDSCSPTTFKNILSGKNYGINNEVSFCVKNNSVDFKDNKKYIHMLATCKGAWEVNLKTLTFNCTTGWENKIFEKLNSCKIPSDNCECFNKGEEKILEKNIDCNIKLFGENSEIANYSGTYSKSRTCDGCHWSELHKTDSSCKLESCNGLNSLKMTGAGLSCVRMSKINIGSRTMAGSNKIVEFCGYKDGIPTHGKAGCKGNWEVNPKGWSSNCDTGWIADDDDFYPVKSCP